MPREWVCICTRVCVTVCECVWTVTVGATSDVETNSGSEGVRLRGWGLGGGRVLRRAVACWVHHLFCGWMCYSFTREVTQRGQRQVGWGYTTYTQKTRSVFGI